MSFAPSSVVWKSITKKFVSGSITITGTSPKRAC